MRLHTEPLNSKKSKRILLSAAAAVILMLVLIRSIQRQGELLLFRYNLGFSIEEAGILYDFQTVMLLLVSLFVFTAVFFLILPPPNRRPSYERFFALTALALGLIYLFVITPLSVPDESTHYLAISELTNGLFGMPDTAYALDPSGFSNQNNVCTGYLRVIRDLFGRDSDPNVIQSSLMSYMWTLVYPLEYAPQVLGFAISRLLSFNDVTTFMMGRFFNLLFYVVCLYISVKRVPRFKLLFGLSGILPMAMQQAASLSYDNFINALSMVLLSSLLREIFSEGALTLCDLLYIFIPALLLAPAKGVYALFILLFIFISKERFTGKCGKTGCFWLLFASCAAAFIAVSAPSLLRIMHSTPPSYGDEGGESYTLRFFLTNPGDAFGIFKNSFNVYFSTWFAQAVGQSLSTCLLELPTWIVPAFTALLILSAQNIDGNELDMPRGMRPALLALSAAVVLSFMATMFLTWIHNTDKIIVGVQGRYFIPILPLLMLSLNNKIVVLRKNIDRGMTVLAILLSARTVLAILDFTMFNV